MTVMFELSEEETKQSETSVGRLVVQREGPLGADHVTT